MPLICKDCSNKTRFKRTEHGSCNYSESQMIDENEDIRDGYGMEYDDYECLDYDDLECDVCGSGDVESVNDDEWEVWDGPDVEDEEGYNDNGDPVRIKDEPWSNFLKRKRDFEEKKA